MTSHILRLSALAFAAVAALSAPARADLLQLKDGRFVDGVKLVVEADHVLVRYTRGDVKVPLDMVEDWVLDGVPPPEPRTDEEREKRAQGLVRYRGKWVKPELRDKGIADAVAKRRAEIEERRSHLEWRNRYKWETRNFTFESTLPPAVGEEYAATLETYFEHAKKEWSLKVPKDWGKLKVCLYHDRKSFNQVSGGRGGTLAYYRFVAPRELNCYWDRLAPDFSIACMLHEATHYVADLIDDDSQFPHWINESVAEYFGASRVDPKAKTVQLGGMQPGRLTEVRSDISAGTRVRLQDLIGKGDGDYRHYTWGWTFVHFMFETPAYSKKFRKYFVDLAKAKDVQRERSGFGFTSVSGDECLRVFLDRFGKDSLEAIEKEWWAYIDKLEAPGVRGYEHAGIEAYSQGLWKLRAPRLLKAAIDGGTTNPKVYETYAHCLLLKARGKDAPEAGEALAVLDKGLAVCDPLCADLWAAKGYVLHSLDRKPEAEQCVELAREMNPDDQYLGIEIAEAMSGSGE